MESNKTIAKNTIALYFRMIVLMLVTLYTSRVILDVLGIEDYGIYSLVNGVVLSFAFVRNVLLSAAQRFFATAIGNKDVKELSSYYSTSIVIFVITGFAISLLMGVIGYWFITSRLQIPAERMYAAVILFYLTIADFFFSFVRIPYNALIISYERMSFFAYISVAEAFLKLGTVYILMTGLGDKLITYGILLLTVTILINGIYIGYVTIKLPDCKFSKDINKQHARSILSFSGWSLYEAMSNVAKTEGVGFIMNTFCGVTINAAVGIAKQATSAVYSFIGNFQTAFRPQITKNYAAGELNRLEVLIYSSAKLSSVIFMVVAVPLCLNLDYVLQLWLKTVPEYTHAFTICLIASLSIETLGGPLWMTSHAIGDIKMYQLINGTVRLLNLPLVYILLKNNVSPSYVYTFQLIFDVVILIYRIHFLKNKVEFSVKKYYVDVVLKLLIITAIAIVGTVFLKQLFAGDFFRLIISVAVSIIVYGICTWSILLNSEQRAAMKLYIVNTLRSKHIIK